MSGRNTDAYWDERAQKGTFYEGEWFYTVTPIPYYKARRNLIIERIAKNVKEGMSVLDYGCGDGEYIRLLSHMFRDVSFTGIDVSERMIERAKRNLSGQCSFICSGSGVKDGKLYDVIYTSAIMAHLSDDITIGILDNLNQHLKGGGRYIMCEQSSVEYMSGPGWCRRTPETYINYLQSAGFKIEGKIVIDFWLHRIFFELFLAPYIARVYRRVKHIKDDSTMLELNKIGWYRCLSSMLTKCSFFPKRNSMAPWGGYVLIEASRE